MMTVEIQVLHWRQAHKYGVAKPVHGSSLVKLMDIMPRILNARVKLSSIGDSVDTTTAQEQI